MSKESSRVILLISTGCVHCSALLQLLTERVKAGDIGRLEVVNLAVDPQPAEQYGVRSVPWFVIDNMEFEGSMSEKELLKWLQTNADNRFEEYFMEMIKQGRLPSVKRYLERQPQAMQTLISMSQKDGQDLSVRIGISAIMEELAGGEILNEYIEDLIAMAKHPAANIRGDAAYYMGLSGNSRARSTLQGMLQDNDKSVREIAQESLEDLTGKSA